MYINYNPDKITSRSNDENRNQISCFIIFISVDRHTIIWKIKMKKKWQNCYGFLIPNFNYWEKIAFLIPFHNCLHKSFCLSLSFLMSFYRILLCNWLVLVLVVGAMAESVDAMSPVPVTMEGIGVTTGVPASTGWNNGTTNRYQWSQCDK